MLQLVLASILQILRDPFTKVPVIARVSEIELCCHVTRLLYAKRA
jgi:hypothetical protein